MEKLADYQLKAEDDTISRPVSTETPFGNIHRFFLGGFFFKQSKTQEQNNSRLKLNKT